MKRELRSAMRVVTTPDFDGVVSAALLKSAGFSGQIQFATPQDIHSGNIEFYPTDILVNLPNDPRCLICFQDKQVANGIDRMHGRIVREQKMDSTARVIYRFLDGENTLKHFDPTAIEFAEKSKNHRYAQPEIMQPKGWGLIDIACDIQTGLSRFREFTLTDVQLLLLLIDLIATEPLEQIFSHSAIKERVSIYNQLSSLAYDQLIRCTTMKQSVAVVDLRKEKVLYPASRFLVHSVYRECGVAVYLLNTANEKRALIALDESPFTPTNRTNIQSLLKDFGGTGTQTSGQCEVSSQYCELIKEEIVDRINQSAGRSDRGSQKILDTHLETQTPRGVRTPTTARPKRSPSATQTWLPGDLESRKGV